MASARAKGELPAVGVGVASAAKGRGPQMHAPRRRNTADRHLASWQLFYLAIPHNGTWLMGEVVKDGKDYVAVQEFTTSLAPFRWKTHKDSVSSSGLTLPMPAERRL